VGADPVECTASDECHVAGECNPVTGLCSDPAAPDGTACDDQDACTQSDTCQAGECTGGDPVECEALDECHLAGECDPATGECSNPLKPDGEPCTDGECQEGECVETDPGDPDGTGGTTGCGCSHGHIPYSGSSVVLLFLILGLARSRRD
jgi:hypothetical protein